MGTTRTESGLYIPTLTDISGLDAAPVAVHGCYVLVGTVVQCWLACDVNPTGAAAAFEFHATLPPGVGGPARVGDAGLQAISGVGVPIGGSISPASGAVVLDVASGLASFQGQHQSGLVRSWSWHFAYLARV